MRRLHRHEPKVWLLWAIGAALLIATPFALADPAVWMLLLDPELVAAIALGGLALVGGSFRHALAQLTARVPRRRS
jgi:hypothetical protein